MSPYTIPEETLLNLVNAAKALKRVKTVKRRNYWMKRLFNRVKAYEEAEAMIKQRLKNTEAFEKAAKAGQWLSKDGKLTPYKELGDEHLERILNHIERQYMSPQESFHWEGLINELRRRSQQTKVTP